MDCVGCARKLDHDWKYCPDCGWHIPEYAGIIRKRVFDVIVRHAMRGADWRNSCVEPMRVNNITEREVLDEIKRRGEPASAEASDESDAKALPMREKLADIRGALSSISGRSSAPVIKELASVIDELERCLRDLEHRVQHAKKLKIEATLEKPAAPES